MNMVKQKSPELLLEMRGIAKRFGNFYALQDVNLDIYRGEIHALMGENGAEKVR